MNTPAHLALSLALLGRRGRRGDWWWIGAGAILPDIMIFARHFGMRGEAVEIGVPALNSAVVWGAVLALGLLGRRTGAVLLAASALLHIAFDLPLHAGDARAHFWPLTDWRFVSPVSFWDHDHHGRIFGLLEGVLFSVSFAVIWSRLRRGWSRAVAAVFAGAYALTFAHFLGHAFADAHWAVW